ncbi:ITG-like peptide [Drosophila erecta]|uniref:Prohormone-3 n=1 Tax=Drosophila erecta TaxID=7220 RepID=B3N832_DROER|nr:ITG-like peptide [Drosophila erecta]EDV59445.1 uncharacterized protein Dere_GG10602 [Drosophila erecta]
MSIFPRWAAMLLLLGLAHQLDPSLAASSSSFASGNPWQRSLFGRDSRNLMHRRAPFSGAADLRLDEYLVPYGAAEQEQHQPHPPPQQMRQETEVYGIVEPLIEDTPCADRPCLLNNDCCPSGVCVSTYGEGKCVYVFGRQRDLCQGHADCPQGSSCMLVPQEGVWRCEPSVESGGSTSLLEGIFGPRERQPLGSECSSSSDCQVINGMCCQQQRFHHRAAIKLSCGYFRDAFDCVDMVGAEHRRN